MEREVVGVCGSATECLFDVVEGRFCVAVVVIIERTEVICVVERWRLRYQLIERGVCERALAVVDKVGCVLEVVLLRVGLRVGGERQHQYCQ